MLHSCLSLLFGRDRCLLDLLSTKVKKTTLLRGKFNAKEFQINTESPATFQHMKICSATWEHRAHFLPTARLKQCISPLSQRMNFVFHKSPSKDAINPL